MNSELSCVQNIDILNRNILSSIYKDRYLWRIDNILSSPRQVKQREPIKMAKRSTTNYLNNKDLIKEIHKSKITYCYVEDKKYTDYDAIVIDKNVLIDNEACLKETGVTLDEWIDAQISLKEKRLTKETAEEVTGLTKEDLVIRIMTFEHIPVDDEWPDDKPKKKLADGYKKVNFPPFIQVIFTDNGLKTVVKSHHTQENKFSINHGRSTDKLGKMFYLLVEKIGQKGNWRNYSYLEDMKSSGLLQLAMVGLQFNESRGQVMNPFAFLTTVVYNAFKRVLNSEKKDRDLRDDLLEQSGQAPSISRQISNEMDASELWHTSSGEFREKNKPRRPMPQRTGPMFGKPAKTTEEPIEAVDDADSSTEDSTKS